VSIHTLAAGFRALKWGISSHPTLLVSLALVAGDDSEAGMAGEIQIVGIEQRGGSGQAPQHRRLQVVHHDLKEGKGVLVAGEELLHGLGEGELHIPHAAVAEHHDKERQLAAGFAHGHRAVVAPVDLGALAGGEGQGQEGRGPAWTHRAHVILHDGVAPLEAVLAQALEDLLGAVGVGLQPLADVGFAGIELACARCGLAWAKARLGNPLGHRAPIQAQGLSDLLDLQGALLGSCRRFRSRSWLIAQGSAQDLAHGT
jgi:hypothetical protein